MKEHAVMVENKVPLSRLCPTGSFKVTASQRQEKRAGQDRRGWGIIGITVNHDSKEATNKI